MGNESKKEYLEAIRKRYKKASKIQKSIILNEFCQNCNYSRKHAIKLLSQKPKQSKKKRGKKKKYDSPLLIKVIKDLWLATGQLCSKRLVEAIPTWLPFYENKYGTLPDCIRNNLSTISDSTIDRLLKPIRAKTKRKGLSGTKPGTLLKQHIPIKTDQWDEKRPGFLEADTVAHCGGSLMGDFVWSVTMTDIASGWTECRASWNKGYENIMEQIENIENELPFSILGFDSDNGNEFMNWHLYRYFENDLRTQPVQFTRGRPYHKDDNAHVEQKNWSCVRQLFGYDRFENQELVKKMNNLYKNFWAPYQNFFLPSFKLIEKSRINGKQTKIHDNPKTPYQRLLESEHISNEIKSRLKEKYATLNPFDLKYNLEKNLRLFFKSF